MSGSSYPPTYDGISADEYIAWEIAVDNIFANRFMCPRRKVNNAASVLRLSALTWWESLTPLDKPQTWDDMKFLMRETFANPYHIVNSYDKVFQLEDHSIVVSPAVPNLMQDSGQTQVDKDDAKQNEELTTSCANSEPSSHNAPITHAKNMNIGNAHGATLTEGEASLDVCDATYVIPMQPLIQEHAICLLGSNTCAENRHFLHIASDVDEPKLLSSLSTLGYIELDVLCNLSYLEEKLFGYADFPWFSRHTYHAIGKYNNNGQYIIQRV